MKIMFEDKSKTSDGIWEITPQSLHEALERNENIKVVDVRRPEEFNGELGHIVGAELVTLETDLKDALEDWDRGETIVFVCRVGGRSAKATIAAQKMGYKDVYNMEGGMTKEMMATYGPMATFTAGSVEIFLKNAVQMSDLLLSGVLQRYPDIQFVSVESGIGWVPFVLEACDYAFVDGQVAQQRPVFGDLLPAARELLKLAGPDDLLVVGYDPVLCRGGKPLLDEQAGHIDVFCRELMAEDNARWIASNPS